MRKVRKTIRLSLSETRLLESGTPAAFDLRSKIHTSAQQMGERIEVYASAHVGGYLADVVTKRQ